MIDMETLQKDSVKRAMRIKRGVDDYAVAGVSYLITGIFALICFIPFFLPPTSFQTEYSTPRPSNTSNEGSFPGRMQNGGILCYNRHSHTSEERTV